MDALEATVAICTYNRARDLRTALAMLCEQELPRPDFRWEVLVVDNASTDETPRVVEEFRDRLPVRYVREEGRGAGHSRNCAIRSFRSDLLIFIDDDEFPAEGWLREMWNATVRWPNIEVFQGRVLPRWSSEIPRWLPMEREYQVRSPLPEIDLGESEELLDIPRFTTANAAAAMQG